MIWDVKIYLSFRGKSLLFALLEAVLLAGGDIPLSIVHRLGEDRENSFEAMSSVQKLAEELT